MVATVLNSTGEEETRTLCTPESLRHDIGGYIDVVQTTTGQRMWVNEDGEQCRLPINVKATLLYVGAKYPAIYGDAVIEENTVQRHARRQVWLENRACLANDTPADRRKEQ